VDVSTRDVGKCPGITDAVKEELFPAKRPLPWKMERVKKGSQTGWFRGMHGDPIKYYQEGVWIDGKKKWTQCVRKLLPKDRENHIINNGMFQ
jgi:hypothetical protein